MAGKPLWRRAFDAVERPVGGQLERLVQTEAFADVAGGVLRLRAALSRQVERTSRQALHRANLPAASDISRLREQLAGMERTLRRLDAQLETQLAQRRAGEPHDRERTSDGGSEQPARTGTARRAAQSAARPQRGEIRGRNRPAAGGGNG